VNLSASYLQQALLSVAELSFFPLQQAQRLLQPQAHLPLMRYLIKAAIESTKATFIKMHIAIACIGMVPLMTSCIIFSSCKKLFITKSIWGLFSVIQAHPINDAYYLTATLNLVGLIRHSAGSFHSACWASLSHGFNDCSESG
jgi:hypothetical protein